MAGLLGERTFRILNGNDKVRKDVFWKLEEARPGAGRRRFKEKEIKRTISTQRKDIRKKSFGSRIQDPWNSLDDSVKKAKTPKGFRKAYRKARIWCDNYYICVKELQKLSCFVAMWPYCI